MAHFYGTVDGRSRTEGTRCGTRSSGLRTVAASWAGAVQVNLYIDENGADCCEIRFIRWEGCGTDKLVYDGPIDPGDQISDLLDQIKEERTLHHEDINKPGPRRKVRRGAIT